MVNLSIVVHDAEEGVRVSTETELDRVIHIACEEARARNMLNIVFLEAVNGNVLSLVVGGDDTVLSSIHGHRNPPYYASNGVQASTRPVITCCVVLVHHTEFPRKYVIPFEKGWRYRTAHVVAFASGRLAMRTLPIHCNPPSWRFMTADRDPPYEQPPLTHFVSR
jgi:hypothetical protein